MKKIEKFEDLNCWQESRVLEFSNASSMEVKSMLYLFEDLEYLEKDELGFLFEQVTKTQKLILGFIRYLKNK